MAVADDLQICCACGTQFDSSCEGKALQSCRICDDPRQFVPATGQAWTTLSVMRSSATYRNSFEPISQTDEFEKRLTSISTSPKFAIGQRCILIETQAHGNVLWDCITYLDEETIAFIEAKGGLSAIVISHPHYYTTHLEWAKIFRCPVYLAKDDEMWLSQVDEEGRRSLFEETTLQVVEGVTAIKVGGHFPGSLCLLWQGKLMIADSLVTVPSAYSPPQHRLLGTTSFAFMYSIPNMIPLPPSELHKMWTALKPFDFTSTHGAFVGAEVRSQELKERVLESMKIQVRGMGWGDHALLAEAWP